MQDYSLIEKLAIVKSLDQIIIANGKIEPGEEKMLEQIQEEMKFNKSFVAEARLLSFSESLDILRRMPLKRKKLFAELMHKIAISDGFVDEQETNLIIEIYKRADFDIESPNNMKPELDLSYIFFESNRYYNYPDGIYGSREYIKIQRQIKIEPVVFSPDEYSLMIYNADQKKSLWGREIAFSPINLKIDSNRDGVVKMVSDCCSGTEVDIFHEGSEVEKIVFNSSVPFRCLEFVI